jgi:hypothetical protein
VDVERLKQEYSFKTDDELLVLLADSGSLADEAYPLLREELRRRNLSDRPADINDLNSAAYSSKGGFRLLRAKWVGLWLVNTLNATLGVMVAVGFINYSIKPFAGRAIFFYLTQGPYYPLLIGVAFLAEYFTYRWIRGSYCYWVWILPAVSMMIAMAYWKASKQASWIETLGYFLFRRLPYPEASLQLATTGIFLMSLTYSMAALARAAARRSGSPVRRDV